MKRTDELRQELLKQNERALAAELLWAAAGKAFAAGIVLCVLIGGIFSEAVPGAVPLWQIIFAVLSLSIITGVVIRFIKIQKKL